MTQFAHCFLLVFGQLGLGGFICLGQLPFHDIERGFYKSSAAVFLASALTISAGEIALLWNARQSIGAWRTTEAVAWAAFSVAAAVYLASLWGDPYRRRALAYVATLATGTLATVVAALGFSPAPLLSLETILYPVDFLVSAVLLGATTTGMLLGHWYLIDVGMPLEPFMRIWRWYRTSLIVQLVTIALTLGALHLLGAAETRPLLAALWNDHQALFATRLLLGPLPALVIAWMIRRTLAIPQTMAATGLFYVAVLTTVVGEFLGRFLLYRTSLPL